jgi:hypothetical protein
VATTCNGFRGQSSAKHGGSFTKSRKVRLILLPLQSTMPQYVIVLNTARGPIIISDLKNYY